MDSDEEEASEQMHELRISAIACIDHCNHRLVVAVGKDTPVTPGIAPHDTGQYNWEEFLHCDGSVCDLFWPEVLEPVPSGLGSTAQPARHVREQVMVGRLVQGAIEHGDSVPVLQEGVPPRQIGAKSSI